jgi:two-component system alkaline phosphatase synthesis response regulator PhoP
MDELLARIETNLRREVKTTDDAPNDNPWSDPTLPDFCFGPFRVNYKLAGLFLNDQRLPLTFQEFRLLYVFIHFRQTVLDADTLLSKAWGYETNVTSRTLYVHMSWLRKKIRSPERPEGYIKTVRRFGYLFEP